MSRVASPLPAASPMHPIRHPPTRVMHTTTCTTSCTCALHPRERCRNLRARACACGRVSGPPPPPLQGVVRAARARASALSFSPVSWFFLSSFSSSCCTCPRTAIPTTFACSHAHTHAPGQPDARAQANVRDRSSGLPSFRVGARKNSSRRAHVKFFHFLLKKEKIQYTQKEKKTPLVKSSFVPS